MPTRTVLLLSILCLASCGREEPPDSAPPVASTPAPTAPAAPSSPAPGSAPGSAAASVKSVLPEDRVDDAAKEAPVRAKAIELGAIRPDVVVQLRYESNVVVPVLVRGDAHAGAIYGSGPYTLDSRLRTAVIHAGLLQQGELGLVRLRVVKHEGDHPSVPQHGVIPHKWGPYHASYTLEKIDIPTP